MASRWSFQTCLWNAHPYSGRAYKNKQKMSCTNILQTGDNKTTDYRNQIWIWDKHGNWRRPRSSGCCYASCGATPLSQVPPIFSRRKGGCSHGNRMGPPFPNAPSPQQNVPQKINLLPQKEIKMSKSPNPSSLFRTNSLLVWGFEVRVDAIHQMACLSSYRSQVFWMRKKPPIDITLGPQQPLEKWKFYTPKYGLL